MNRSLRFAAPAAALALLATPAAADAQATATLVPATPCIRFVDFTVKSFPIQLAGFAPNSLVTIAADGTPIDTAQTDAAGSFQGGVSAPTLGTNSNRKNVSITADDGQGHTAGPVALPEVRLTVDWPDRASGNPRVLFRAYGFEPGKNVYLHIRKQGKTKGTFKLGKADAPCGLTRRRLHYMPVNPHSAGTYDYYFDQHKRFKKATTILHYRVTITRTFHAAGATAPSPWAPLAAPRLAG